MAIASAEDIHPQDAFNISKSDSVPVNATRGIWVGGVGDVTARFTGSSSDVTFTAVAAGTLLRGSFQFIKASTTATLIVGYR